MSENTVIHPKEGQDQNETPKKTASEAVSVFGELLSRTFEPVVKICGDLVDAVNATAAQQNKVHSFMNTAVENVGKRQGEAIGLLESFKQEAVKQAISLLEKVDSLQQATANQGASLAEKIGSLQQLGESILSQLVNASGDTLWQALGLIKNDTEILPGIEAKTKDLLTGQDYLKEMLKQASDKSALDASTNHSKILETFFDLRGKVDDIAMAVEARLSEMQKAMSAMQEVAEENKKLRKESEDLRVKDLEKKNKAAMDAEEKKNKEQVQKLKAQIANLALQLKDQRRENKVLEKMLTKAQAIINKGNELLHRLDSDKYMPDVL